MEVYRPDGQLAATVTDHGKFIRLEVPPGGDGKAWSFRKLSLGRLWMLNAPNTLAASPDALLIPRELRKD